LSVCLASLCVFFKCYFVILSSQFVHVRLLRVLNKDQSINQHCVWRKGIDSISEKPWISGLCDRFAPHKQGFNSHWYPHQSLVAAGRAAGRHCSRAPVNSYHLGRHVQALEQRSR